ncbi:MAG: hypothetical protein IPM34_07570 [Saprospiraceae bacterium]|nr:hypothetical protein [Saprospiraceae bacterium]
MQINLSANISNLIFKSILYCCSFLFFINLQAQDTPGLEKKIYDNIRLLESLIQTIANKKVDIKIRRNTIEQAIELFNNDTAKVELIPKQGQAKKSLPIREYLNRVLTYGYKSVEINWKYINIIDEIRLGDDGFYYGKVKIYQEFTGTSKRSYRDITTKDIEVRIEKKYNKTGKKNNDFYYELKLNGIGNPQIIDGKIEENTISPKPKSVPTQKP